MSATFDSANINRQSEKGVATLEKPAAQADDDLFGILRKYSGIASEVSGAVTNITGGNRSQATSAPKPAGSTDSSFSFYKPGFGGGAIFGIPVLVLVPALGVGLWFAFRKKGK